MVCFLVTRGESSEDQDVLVRNLIQATPLEAYPVCVFFDTEVQGLPVLPPLDVVLFNEIGTLAAVESGNHVQRLIIEGDRCMEVTPCVQTRHLSPSITANIVDLALVHGLARQRATDSIDTRPRSASKHRCQRMGAPLKYHVPPLLQSLINELVARLCRLTWLSTTRQEYPALLVFDRHKVCWYLNVDDVGAIGMRTKVVHEQVVRIVDKEMQGVYHFSVVADKRHLDCLFYHLGYRLFGSLFLLEQLNLHLLFRLFKKEFRFPDDLL